MLCPDRYGVLFEKHCEEGPARLGTMQRLQAMSNTVLESITEWLANNPDATQEVKTRLDLGYLTYTVPPRPPPPKFPAVVIRHA